MEKKRALEYWINRYNSAKGYNDIHWDAEERHEHRDYIRAMEWAIKAIEQYTDVQPIHRGQWVRCGKLEGKIVMKCSVCGQGITAMFAPKYHYCPNCGAGMCEPV